MRDPAFTEELKGDGVTLTVNYFYDDSCSPEDLLGDTPIKIAYLKRSREYLGTEPVDEERMHEIGLQIDSGDLIGLPVYAYVHSGATIRCAERNPFSCPWDSGMSGYVYMDVDAAAEFGNPEAALRCHVEEFDKILQGDVYGYEIEDEDGTFLDSCWGHVGQSWVKEAAHDAASYWLDKLSRERREEREERAYWNARGVVTEANALAFSS